LNNLFFLFINHFSSLVSCEIQNTFLKNYLSNFSLVFSFESLE